MIDPETSAVMDNLVRPLLDSENRELDCRLTNVAAWAVRLGVPSSGFAFFKRIAVHFDHYRDKAGSVWAAMLRVLDEKEIHSSTDLAGDLKQKFDAYMSGPAKRTRSRMAALGQLGHPMPKETFDDVFEETRARFHNEIDLRCRRARGGNQAVQIRIEELNVGDSYTASQVGAMGPRSHAQELSFHQVNVQQLGRLDMRTLAFELTSLRRALKQIATEQEHDIAIGQVAAAEAASQKGDAGAAMRHLRSAGKWVLDVATEIGVNVASEAIKKSMGL